MIEIRDDEVNVRRGSRGTRGTRAGGRGGRSGSGRARVRARRRTGSRASGGGGEGNTLRKYINFSTEKERQKDIRLGGMKAGRR